MSNSIKRIINRYLFSFPRNLLCTIYKFDSWHTIPMISKNYAKAIIRYCNNNFEGKSVVEIGCGLGDIIRRINSKNKTGLDIDQKVLNAAHFLSKKIHFQQFSFVENTLIGNYDIILLVNWIHEIKPEILKERIEVYFNTNLNINGIIIIDIVKNTDYMYNHKIKYLAENINCIVEKIYEELSGREIYLIRKYEGCGL